MAQLMEIEPSKVEELHRRLVTPGIDLPEKYRVLFSLRNIKGTAAYEALLDGGSWRSSGASVAGLHALARVWSETACSAQQHA